ncbi:MAG: flagellar biosynthesis protein FliC [Ignavibacteriales bacterium]|nr:flagellar biosynthesis protein FliC [Ignavibacteriales bacterium]
MSFRINTNVYAQTAYYALAGNNRDTVTAQLRIATGKRINSVADDTSGFQIGTSLGAKLAGMKAAQNNVNSAKNLLVTAESSLISVSDLLVKIEGKLLDDQNPTADTQSIADDIKSLAKEISSVLESTKFNNTSLLTGGSDAEAGFVFQVGNTYTDKMTLDFASAIATSAANGFNNSVGNFKAVEATSLTTTATMSTLHANLSTLKSIVSAALGKIGNYVQRLDIREDTLNISMTNAQASYSRLFDADVAMEQLHATRGSILGQAATSMLSQLNQSPQQVLSLFK